MIADEASPVSELWVFHTDMDALATSHGLSRLTPDRLERMRELFLIVAQAGQRIPRMTCKFIEPAGIFRLPIR